MTHSAPLSPPSMLVAGDAGITMRDYFAAAIITGICAGPHHLAHMTNPDRVVGEARLAYAIADAMIIARA